MITLKKFPWIDEYIPQKVVNDKCISQTGVDEIINYNLNICSSLSSLHWPSVLSELQVKQIIFTKDPQRKPVHHNLMLTIKCTLQCTACSSQSRYHCCHPAHTFPAPGPDNWEARISALAAIPPRHSNNGNKPTLAMNPGSITFTSAFNY